MLLLNSTSIAYLSIAYTKPTRGIIKNKKTTSVMRWFCICAINTYAALTHTWVRGWVLPVKVDFLTFLKLTTPL